MRILIILFLTFLIFSCDLFVKKNPSELIQNKNKSDYISYSKTFNTGINVDYIFITNDNKTLYAISTGIIYYTNINEDGSLNNLISTGYSASNMFLISPDNKFIYVITGAFINVYNRNNDGSINLKNSTNYAYAFSLAFITPDGKQIFTSDSSSIYYFDVNGSIVKPHGNIANIAPHANQFIFASKDNLFIYSVDSSHYLYNLYKREPLTGKIFKTFMNKDITSGNLDYALISNDQNHIYGGQLANLIKYKRDLQTGLLTSFTLLSSSASWLFLKISNDDKRLYAVNSGGTVFTSFNLIKNQYDFQYTMSAGITSFAVSPNNKFIYAGNSSSISIFERTIE